MKNINSKIKYKRNKYQRAFTLVETMVAITILTSSILALLGLVSQSLSNSTFAKKKMVASYLAQESVEYMRNLRDTHVLYDSTSSAQTGWNNFIAQTTTTCDNTSGANPNGCYLDDKNVNFGSTSMPMESLLLPACTSATCSNAQILYDSSSGKYGYVATGTTTNSGFTRKIITLKLSNDEVKVSSTVYWTQGGATYNVTFSEDLFNWVE